MSTLSSSLSRSQTLVDNPQPMSNVETTSSSSSRWNESKKPLYQVDQQVKFLLLDAEVESLLQQMQIIDQQRLATATSTTYS